MPVNCLIFASMDFLRLPSLPPWVLFLVHVLVDLLVSGNALHALRRRLSDPTNVLQSWDPTLVNPCTWFHVTCDSDNHVIRLWDSSHSILLFFCLHMDFMISFNMELCWNLTCVSLRFQGFGKFKHFWDFGAWNWRPPVPSISVLLYIIIILRVIYICLYFFYLSSAMFDIS